MSKRYIEDVLPLAELDKYAQNGRHRLTQRDTPYFTRSPLGAARAMILAALVDAPQAEAEREALGHLLVKLSSEGWPEMSDLPCCASKLINNARGGCESFVVEPSAAGSRSNRQAARCDSEPELQPQVAWALVAD